METGDKVKVNKDIPSINGMLREGTVVRVDEILLTKLEKDNIRVVDDVGKIWWVNSIDLKT